MFTQFEVESKEHEELIDITGKIQKIVNQRKIKNGTCFIFIPHTTAAITINENADPTVKEDILSKLEELIPWEDNYKHLEGNSAAHIKASLFGNSEEFIIKEGRLVLGGWQGIYLAEFDGSRKRTVQVKLLID